MTVPETSPSITSRDAVRDALRIGGTVDITTHGRRSGQSRRIEIVFFNFNGRLYISGMPGRRGWYANVVADPRMTLHLKHGIVADLAAMAIPITDEPNRRALLTRITHHWRRDSQLEAFVAGSPLIEVVFDDESLLAA